MTEDTRDLDGGFAFPKMLHSDEESLVAAPILNLDSYSETGRKALRKKAMEVRE